MREQTRPPGERERKAVALRYDAGRDVAPRVVAKGKGFVAQEILARAEGKVPVVEDAALTELLYPLALEETIPEELYAVVAEVFAFVYQLEKGGGRG